MNGEGVETSSGALHLLRTQPRFRALWGARTTSLLGSSLSLVSLLLYVANTTGEAMAVALLLLVGDFGPAMLGPLSGTVSDRFDLKRIMLVCDLVQGVLVLVIAIALPSLPLLLVLVGVRAVAGQIFQPASRAAMPVLVHDRDLASANSALGFGMNGAEALGPMLAAVLLPAFGVRGVLLVDACSFFVSAAILAFLPSLPPAARERDEGASFLRDAKAGLLYIWSVPTVRILGLGYFAIVAFNGIDDVALVFLAKDALHGGDAGASALYAAVGVGLIVGYMLLGRYSGLVPMVFLLVSGFAVSSAGNLLSGLAGAISAAFIVQMIRGIGISAMDVAANTLVQRVVPQAMLGRVFGNLYGAIGIAAGLSYALGGLLLDRTSARSTFLIAGAGGLLATLATALAFRHAARSRTS